MAKRSGAVSRVVPRVIVDTSTLFTLLLSDPEVPGHKDMGLLFLLSYIARHGLIKLVIPDMVAAEFLNSPVPLNERDILVYGEPGKDDNAIRRRMRYRSTQGGRVVEYAKAPERIQFLRELLEGGHCEIYESAYGHEYMRAVCAEPELAALYQRLANVRSAPTEAKLKKWLLQDAPAVEEQKKIHRFVSVLRQKSLRKDSGERSIADVVAFYQAHSDGHPSLVLYQGEDVRGQIIARRNAQAATSYSIKECNPHTGNPATFNPHTLEVLRGAGGFVTTVGFLAPIMERFHEIDQFLVRRDEWAEPWSKGENSPRAANVPKRSSVLSALRPMIDNAARELGGRFGLYDAWKDQRFEEVQGGVVHEHPLENAALHAPWRECVQQWGAEIVREMAYHYIAQRAEYEGLAAAAAEQQAAQHRAMQQARSQSLLKLADAYRHGGRLPVSGLRPRPKDEAEQALVIPGRFVDRIQREATIGEAFVPGRFV